MPQEQANHAVFSNHDRPGDEKGSQFPFEISSCVFFVVVVVVFTLSLLPHTTLTHAHIPH